MIVEELAKKSRIHFNQGDITLKIFDKTDRNFITQGYIDTLPEEIKKKTVISWVVSRANKLDSISDLIVLTR